MPLLEHWLKKAGEQLPQLPAFSAARLLYRFCGNTNCR
jgi:hypothetical protein